MGMLAYLLLYETPFATMRIENRSCITVRLSSTDASQSKEKLVPAYYEHNLICDPAPGC